MCYSFQTFAAQYDVNLDLYPNLYPFGTEAGDTADPGLNTLDGCSSRIDLLENILFFNTSHDNAYVSYKL